MREVTTKFGESAGKIWAVLNEKGILHKDEIIEKSDLKEEDFHTGIGWLARENKISKIQENCFKIDNTNLEKEIGTHAGRVYKILDIWGDVDYTTIQRLSDLQDNEVRSALGWLAREDKIVLDKNKRYTLK